ncbi:hypothetical protein GCM10010302_27110 [Streptomyces polychromogenes]|uniref:Uncharacterized protein n=1 Tax=Streptomyces polychromogenes TaxID=67342 RepID=A0ABP3EZP7_9ACTN
MAAAAGPAAVTMPARTRAAVAAEAARRVRVRVRVWSIVLFPLCCVPVARTHARNGRLRAHGTPDVSYAL